MVLLSLISVTVVVVGAVLFCNSNCSDFSPSVRAGVMHVVGFRQTGFQTKTEVGVVQA